MKEDNKLKQRMKALHARMEDGSALAISSGSEKTSSRDAHYPFRQSSDFFYLTANDAARNCLLLLHHNNEKSALIAPEIDKARIIWDGRGANPKDLAKSLGVQYIAASDPVKEALKLLKGTASIYFQNEEGSLGFRLARELLAIPSHSRGKMPQKFIHSDALLEPLRLHKSREEIEAIKQAVRIAALGFEEVLPSLPSLPSEKQFAALLDCYIRLQHSEPSFATIVACAENAATLHHTPTERRFRKQELVLVDWGSTYHGLASDISRVVPVSGSFTSQQGELYDLVLESQAAAIAKVRPGVLVSDIHKAAASVLISGLKSLKILSGATPSILKSGKYKPYFPHGIGHSLGLDVHDIGDMRNSAGTRLEAGMVITIEPGLYFSTRQKGIPACGFRIEDDVLVTKNGREILSAEIPKKRAEILSWCQ